MRLPAQKMEGKFLKVQKIALAFRKKRKMTSRAILSTAGKYGQPIFFLAASSGANGEHVIRTGSLS